MTAPQTWLPTEQAARAAGLTTKALRRRIERGTVVSELRDDGRRHVVLESIVIPGSPDAPPRRGRGAGQQLLPPGAGAKVEIPPLLERLEALAAENGRLRALTAIAESTEQALTNELHQARALVTELEHLDRELATAGPIRAWRIARQRRVMERQRAITSTATA